MPPLTDHSYSFIVRVWSESGDGASRSREWRGSIEEVESGQRLYYTDLSAMLVFIRGYMTADDETGASDPHGR